MYRSLFMHLTSMEDKPQKGKRKKFLGLNQTNYVSVNSNDFKIKSNLNACVPLHLFYWAFKLLGF